MWILLFFGWMDQMQRGTDSFELPGRGGGFFLGRKSPLHSLLYSLTASEWFDKRERAHRSAEEGITEPHQYWAGIMKNSSVMCVFLRRNDQACCIRIPVFQVGSVDRPWWNERTRKGVFEILEIVVSIAWMMLGRCGASRRFCKWAFAVNRFMNGVNIGKDGSHWTLRNSRRRCRCLTSGLVLMDSDDFAEGYNNIRYMPRLEGFFTFLDHRGCTFLIIPPYCTTAPRNLPPIPAICIPYTDPSSFLQKSLLVTMFARHSTALTLFSTALSLPTSLLDVLPRQTCGDDGDDGTCDDDYDYTVTSNTTAWSAVTVADGESCTSDAVEPCAVGQS